MLLLHLLIPAIFIASLAFGKTQSRLGWGASFALTASYLLFVHLAGAGWTWVGTFWPWLFWAALIIVALRFVISQAGKLAWRPARAFSPWLHILLSLAITAWFISLLPAMFTARSLEPSVRDQAVALRWPLAGDGGHRIVHGGANEVLNHHFAIDAQRYALDIVETSLLGFRAGGLWPKQLTAYHIWDTPVMAPCAGEIVAVEADLPDRVPPEADSEQPAGNHLAIHCRGVTVILAHLRRHSVNHSAGDTVTAGQPLGNIGNSGNTSEPHLHIHAVSGRVTDREQLLWEGNGVPMLFDGRFLVRNDSVRQN